MKRLSDAQVSGFLGETILLRGLPETELSKLAAVTRHHQLDARASIFAKDQTGTSTYFVVDGRVRIAAASPSGAEMLLGLIEPGEVFGELALADDARRTSNAFADRPSYVLQISRQVLLPVLEANPGSAMALARMLATHLRNAIRNLESLGLHDAERRIWHHLMYLGKRYGTINSETGALRIRHGLSQQDLADSVGLTRVMVNRKLGKWLDQELIESGRGLIDIPDPEALESFVWDASK